MKASPKSYRGKDRRQWYRQRAIFPVDIFRVNERKYEKKWDHEVGTDIGVGGLGIESHRPLPAKANVTVAILLHNEESELLTLDAKLIWTQERAAKGQKTYYMGLEFTHLDPEAKAKIQQYVDAKRKKSEAQKHSPR